MKKLSIVLMAGLVFAACSKKNTPAGTATSTVAATPAVAEAPKPSKEAAAGMETYNAKCGRCHALKKVENWTASEWVPILDDMASKAKLDATEKANVLAYVQFNAKAGK
ncbi:MAG: cytochrome c [Ferruginibacter sp.]